MDPVAEKLFDYLNDVIYDPEHASLPVDELPEGFRDFGDGLRYFAECVMETKTLAQTLARGDLTGKIPSPGNELASPLKSLHASLKHMTWQTQQVAMGDYQQRVSFMGDFAAAFNSMAQQLEERRSAELIEKSRLQQYINLILANAPNILLVFDTDGSAVLASESFVRLYKAASAEDISGKSFSEIFAPLSAHGFLKTMDELNNDALINVHARKTEQSIDIGRDGNLRTYDIHITPVLYESETVMGTMIVFTDITEIIQTRHEAERARELAEQSTRAKSEFMARMTHEMRTPMNAIIGMTSIGGAATDVEKKDYSFKKIKDASTHLLGVINDILDMSKIEADKLELSFGEFDFRNMIDTVANIFNTRVDDKKQKFIIDVDDSIPPRIISDEQRLVQVITNLLSNAVKFTPEHGAVKLTASLISDEPETCTIGFTVKDTGIGISEEQKKRLFTPFEQADGSLSRKFGGTGLGLSICRRIVELMGGKIWVESELEKGASFIFDVVAQKTTGTGATETTGAGATETAGAGAAETAGVGAAESDAVSGAGPGDGGDGALKGKRILIAEDVDINREIINTLLEDTGAQIDFACDGIEAVRKFTAEPNGYDSILMDIQMPEMDGYEAARRIRSSGAPGALKVPIIAMTANVFREDIEQCLAAGMNDHLGKPVAIDEVIAKLKEYIEVTADQ